MRILVTRRCVGSASSWHQEQKSDSDSENADGSRRRTGKLMIADIGIAGQGVSSKPADPPRQPPPSEVYVPHVRGQHAAPLLLT